MSTKRKPPLPRKRCAICKHWYQPRSTTRQTCGAVCAETHRAKQQAAYRLKRQRGEWVPTQRQSHPRRKTKCRLPADLPTWGPGDWLGVDRLGRVVAL